MNAYVELIKPRLTLMAMATAFAGYWLGLRGPFETRVALGALGGVLLVGAASNTLNQFLERRHDLLMRRTASRPLPAGKMRPGPALAYGLVLAGGGLISLGVLTNPLTLWLGILTLISYLAVYTPLKRISPWNTLAGAVPGALPVLMGYAAAAGRLDGPALAYFIFLFIWQLPHFFAIAWVFREDYERAGYRMITLGDAEGKRTFFWMWTTTLATVAASFLPFAVSAAGLTYLFIAIFAGACWTGLAYYVYDRHFSEARKFVISSILYLFAINIMLVLDRAS